MEAKKGIAGMNSKELILKCSKIFKKNSEKIILSNDFLNLDEDIIETIVQFDDLEIDEAELFSGVLRWAENKIKQNPQLKKEILLSKITPHIRYPLFDPITLRNTYKKYSSIIPFDLYIQAMEYFASEIIVDQRSKQFVRRGSYLNFQIEPKTPNAFRINKWTISKSGGQNDWTTAPVFGSQKLRQGIYYWEVLITSINSDQSGMTIGITENKLSSYFNVDMGIGMSGSVYGKCTGGTVVGGRNENIGVLVDFNKGFVKFYKNKKFTGVQGALNKKSTYYPVVHIYYIGDSVQFLFPSRFP
jgi:hypothetical protein